MTVKELDEYLHGLSMMTLMEELERFRILKEQKYQRILIKYQNKLQQYAMELVRLEKMKIFERRAYRQGYHYVAGIDEVGRGPLAGPVYAAAVILPVDIVIFGVDDSKKLSEAKRNELYEEITLKCVSFSYGMATVEEIDTLNIRKATHLAMQRAVEGLDVKPDYLLIDGEQVPSIDLPQEGIIKGDSKSISVAAASILAKVTRDGLMTELANTYPQYGFENNKGYGSAMHIEALRQYGITEVHRKTFTENYQV